MERLKDELVSTEPTHFYLKTQSRESVVTDSTLYFKHKPLTIWTDSEPHDLYIKIDILEYRLKVTFDLNLIKHTLQILYSMGHPNTVATRRRQVESSPHTPSRSDEDRCIIGGMRNGAYLCNGDPRSDTSTFPLVASSFHMTCTYSPSYRLLNLDS